MPTDEVDKLKKNSSYKIQTCDCDTLKQQFCQHQFHCIIRPIRCMTQNKLFIFNRLWGRSKQVTFSNWNVVVLIILILKTKTYLKFFITIQTIPLVVYYCYCIICSTVFRIEVIPFLNDINNGLLLLRKGSTLCVYER